MGYIVFLKISKQFTNKIAFIFGRSRVFEYNKKSPLRAETCENIIVTPTTTNYFYY